MQGSAHRRWISACVGTLLNRSFRMSDEVYAAMMARGFTGHIRPYRTYRMKPADWRALCAALALAVAALLAGSYL